jgi:hypothetical protein
VLCLHNTITCLFHDLDSENSTMMGYAKAAGEALGWEVVEDWDWADDGPGVER